MADVPEDEQQDDGGRVGRRSVLKYGGSSAVAAGLAGCQSPQNPYPGSGLRGSSDDGGGGLEGDDQGEGEQLLSGSTIRFGVLAPTNLPLGQSMWEAAQLAAQQYNESGGMVGAKLEVSLGESNADPNIPPLSLYCWAASCAASHIDWPSGRFIGARMPIRTVVPERNCSPSP